MSELIRSHEIAVIPGDNIGKEIMPEALKTLQIAAQAVGARFALSQFPWGADHYLESGSVMAPGALDTLRKFDAILLGALGDPARVPDATMSWGLVQKVRKGFGLYVNLRPTKTLPSVPSPLRNIKSLDLVIVRENTEGEYSGIGGRLHTGHAQELATQVSIFTREGIERVVRYGFELAMKRPRRDLVSVTKSNAMRDSMVLWDEVFSEIATDYPEVTTQKVHVDAMAMHLVQKPERFDVIVTTNLFGDILSDLAAALQGSIGLATSANLNPQENVPGMFEPIHGSAPDIAGQGIANPLATIMAAALMCRTLGEQECADLIDSAVHATLEQGHVLTPDLGGTATTKEVGAEVTRQIESLAGRS